jgi:rhodanese-related sulfurtransferase
MPVSLTRAELEQLLASDSAMTLVDALPRSYFAQQHLPGAVNIVEEAVAELAPSLMPDKAITVVTYCSNEACSNSLAVARRLESLGYSDVRTYPGGIEDWVAAGHPTESSLVP